VLHRRNVVFDIAAAFYEVLSGGAGERVGQVRGIAVDPDEMMRVASEVVSTEQSAEQFRFGMAWREEYHHPLQFAGGDALAYARELFAMRVEAEARVGLLNERLQAILYRPRSAFGRCRSLREPGNIYRQ
jgi:hypothetical protein